MKPRTAIISLVIISSLVLFYWPIFRWLWNSWYHNEYYSHGFLVPIVAAFFIWIQREHLRSGRPSIVGTFVLGLGAVIYIIGYSIDLRVLGGISLIIVITAICLSIYGLKGVRAIAFPLLFLLFMIPPPFIQDIGYRLQTVSIESSTWLLDILGFPVTASAPEIYLGDTVFTIGLPCSGTNTLIALLALLAVYVYILKGSKYKRALLYSLAIPIAIFANILRIASIVMVAHYHNMDIASGWYHDIASPLFFFMAFLLLVACGWMMRCSINYDMLR